MQSTGAKEVFLCGSSHPTGGDGIRALHVMSTRATTERDENGSEHKAYNMLCVMRGDNEICWNVKRRFNDFVTLHSRLSRYGQVKAELPAKIPFSMFLNVTRTRETGLHTYINTVLGHCNDKQCTALTKFLQVNKHIHRLYADKAPLEQNSNNHHHGELDLEQERVSRCEEVHSPGVSRQRSRSLPREGNTMIVRGVPRSSLQMQYSRDDMFINSRYRNSADKNGEELEEEMQMARPRESGNGDENARDSYGEVRKPLTKAERICQETLRLQWEILDKIKQRRRANDVVHNDMELSERAGVGLFFIQPENGLCIVDEIVVGSPASKCGKIEIGDVLLKVDGELVDGLSLDDVRKKIVGRAGSLVRLEFERAFVTDYDSEDIESCADEVSAYHVFLARQQLPLGDACDEQVAESSDCGRRGREDPPTVEVEQKSRNGEPASERRVPEPKAMRTCANVGGFSVKSSNARGCFSLHFMQTSDQRAKKSAMNRPQEMNETVSKRLSGGSSSSTQSLSHRSTVLASHSTSSESVLSERGQASPSSGSSEAPAFSSKGVESFSVEEVVNWLAELELKEYCDAFKQNRIDGEMLMELNEHDLLNDFGMKNKYHRRRLLRKLHTSRLCAI
ncbi:hypothetical protein GUITHDRAFT_106902 [Guillardia theta CCMP2712]|uniref:SAM domain-containing protein n=1 Tax=Guillardia theta (strain CCMP2712) TaxID=905079 RepID=L1JGL5_GUITC|nr:hypothetical protein GUITHDRAFT_106902 [Guillardia theta CCMP2712]EKX47462.1 hypothetical protein GUITHDRAFT_106902 [Guillardia theta CCMP2712]|mmetsp:Transcript_25339/g.83815  ORF Transcript_25339/g.83815 Transcript_25339/m.83815 type:complete len:622 (-) Transcript_25339:75-1940(-)|eukprot:XP_005834442.1 hypothetical protein GUITHDRAFT_106902 [Guillardia theta CCMP2712]